jgi:viroplasmin and RNaseH domain-containing protein
VVNVILPQGYFLHGISCLDTSYMQILKSPIRGVANALVDRCTSNIFKGFQTFEEAVVYMEQGDIHSYRVFVKKPADEREPFTGDKYYYAIANGCEEGIYEYY